MLEITASEELLPRTIERTSVRLRWVSSIREIDAATWAACFAEQDVLQAYELHTAVEAANLAEVDFAYLIAEEAGETVAIIPCFRFRTSLTVVAQPAVARVVDQVRRLWPGFLYMNIFVIGTPIAICRDLLGLHSRLGRAARRELMTLLLPEVIRAARRHGARLIMLKEMTSKVLPEWRALLEQQFVIAESPATSYLYLGGPGQGSYRERLRKKYRSLMNNRQAKLTKAGMRWEVCHDFSKHAQLMHALYLQVLGNSKIRFETLTPQFFAGLPAQLGPRVFALLCWREAELVAFELFLADERWVHPVYLGMDYRHRDTAALYFNGIYQIIETLESLGKAVVQLGQTSYDVKASIGAVIDRLYVAVHHTNPLAQRLLRRFAPLMFPATQVPRSQRVFRDMQANDAGLAAHGVHFERSEAEQP